MLGPSFSAGGTVSRQSEATSAALSLGEGRSAAARFRVVVELPPDCLGRQSEGSLGEHLKLWISFSKATTRASFFLNTRASMARCASWRASSRLPSASRVLVSEKVISSAALASACFFERTFLSTCACFFAGRGPLFRRVSFVSFLGYKRLQLLTAASWGNFCSNCIHLWCAAIPIAVSHELPDFIDIPLALQLRQRIGEIAAHDFLQFQELGFLRIFLQSLSQQGQTFVFLQRGEQRLRAAQNFVDALAFQSLLLFLLDLAAQLDGFRIGGADFFEFLEKYFGLR